MGTVENLRLDIQGLERGKELVQKGKSPQPVSSTKQCMDTLTHDISFIQQHEETSPRREYMQRFVKSIYKTPHDSNRHVRQDVPDFYGHWDPKAYLDWEHSIEAYFKWHDVLERHRLQFASPN